MQLETSLKERVCLHYFLFFSDDHQPIHVHVAKGRGAINESAVFQVQPNVVLVKNKGLSATELKLAENLVEENQDVIY